MNPELPRHGSELSLSEQITKLEAEKEQLETENKLLLKEVERLKELATKDPLTGLFNRRGFEEEFRRIRELENRTGGLISMAVCDIDNFKSLNDTYGHDIGDKALKFVSDLITKTLRASDVVGRWGGEEFAIVLAGASEEQAVVAAEHIRAAVESAILQIDNVTLRITISIGVAEAQRDDELEKIIDVADKGLYSAKQQGRNRVVKASEM